MEFFIGLVLLALIVGAFFSGYKFLSRRFDFTLGPKQPMPRIQAIGFTGAVLMLVGTFALMVAGGFALEVQPIIGAALGNLAGVIIYLGAGTLLACFIRLLWSEG